MSGKKNCRCETDAAHPITKASAGNEGSSASLSRRGFLKRAGISGLAAAAAPLSARRASAATPDGTPEQIHLTWGEDPSSVVTVSWASLAQAMNPRVLYGHGPKLGKTAHGVQRTYTDGLNGETVFTY